MIKSHLKTINGSKGVELTIMGDEEVIFNEFRALYHKIIHDDKINRIATDALESLKQDEIIKNFKENK